ncbi:hypothetical protein ACQP1G_37865 [Nocardia sp. CA-107356]|uniref:hypothetical protein n=1 Tax=Nocardia sp. CA-107356 TaxID=3239972 RepID=UPI003D8A5192
MMPLVIGVAALVAAWASVVAASWGIALWPLVGGCVLAPVAVWCALVGARLSAARRMHESRHAEEWSRFQAALQCWRSEVAEHDQREQERVASTLLWHPVQPEQRWGQVNLFGGTVDGWASLLATLGLSLLSDGSRLLVLDFTERGVASDLAALARTVGYAVRVDRVPADGVVAVDGLSPAEAGELVSQALAGVLGAQPDTVRTRAVDAELIEAVSGCLEPPRTIERIAAGLALVRRTLDVDQQTCLSAQEIRALNRATEIVGSSAAAADQLRFLAASLRSLARLPNTHLSLGSLWPEAGLRVIETAEANARCKDLLDRLAFCRMVYEVRAAASAPAGAVVIAGADHLGAAELEVLARHAGRVGMRLIVMSEHLRGEQTQLLGAAGSAAVLMRLGHAGEAAAAADFVGRGHRFVLSQLTEQIGRSFTDGLSDTAGDSVTSTVTANSSPTSTGSSDSRSRAMTWSQTTSWSFSQNSSTAQTWARAYEYVVEPTVFQSLPATAFVWVEAGGRGRRVVAGDCNPGIALLDRVARSPRSGTVAVSC